MKTFTIKYKNAGKDLIRPSLTINLKPKPRDISKANPNDDISVMTGKKFPNNQPNPPVS